MQKQNKRPYVIAALIATFGLLFSGIASSYAAGNPSIPDGSITAADLGRGSVGIEEVKYQGVNGWAILNNDVTTVDIKNGSLKTEDLSAAARAELKGATGAQGEAGEQGPKGDDGEDGTNGVNGVDGVVAPVYQTFQANVAKIGGPFSSNATTAGTFTLTAGKYIVTTDGLFRSNATTSGNADLQVAVRAADGTQWGKDLGTAFTGDSPVQANREVTTSTTRVVELAADTEVTVSVFGYDGSGQGSADSGLFDAEVYLTAVPVQ